MNSSPTWGNPAAGCGRERNERDSLLFGLFSDKAGRLYSTVQMMKEYSMQLREMHQTQVDIRQNEIMKFLTIVTTVFMPPLSPDRGMVRHEFYQYAGAGLSLWLRSDLHSLPADCGSGNMVL